MSLQSFWKARVAVAELVHCYVILPNHQLRGEEVRACFLLNNHLNGVFDVLKWSTREATCVDCSWLQYQLNRRASAR